MDKATKQKLLEELRKEYRVELKPIPEAQLTVKDILDKYRDDICDKNNIDKYDWSVTTGIDNAIRKVMCLHYDVWSIKEVPVNKREQFRKDTEKFIKEFILKEK